MDKKMVVRVMVVSFVLLLFGKIDKCVANGGRWVEPGPSPYYDINVIEPLESSEVPYEIVALGEVGIFQATKYAARDGIFLVPVIKAATSRKYYIQKEIELHFEKIPTKGGTEFYMAEWKAHCRVGESNDYGKKFYLSFYLARNFIMEKLKRLYQTSNMQGLKEEEFREKFFHLLHYASQTSSLAKPERIPMYRKFRKGDKK